MPQRFSLNRALAAPVYVQLQEQIRLLVHRGVLQPGNAMPTVRALAVELGVNANTVTRVYRDLQTQGVLRLERGVGTFVAEATHAETIAKRDFKRIAKRARELVQLCRDAGFTTRELNQLIGSTWKEMDE